MSQRRMSETGCGCQTPRRRPSEGEGRLGSDILYSFYKIVQLGSNIYIYLIIILLPNCTKIFMTP